MRDAIDKIDWFIVMCILLYSVVELSYLLPTVDVKCQKLTVLSHVSLIRSRKGKKSVYCRCEN
jgi:hypothetical protein